MATPPPQDESDSESESSSEEIQKPVTKGKKQVAKESTPNVEIKKAAPKVTSKAASIWETSAKVMGNRGSIGVELDLETILGCDTEAGLGCEDSTCTTGGSTALATRAVRGRLALLLTLLGGLSLARRRRTDA